MPPAPKPANQRQRRNRVTTQASLEAGPARRVPLPDRTSPWKCVAGIDRKSGCPLKGAEHELKFFADREIEPHEFVPAPVPWLPLTRAWWNTIWASPMVAEWVDADVPGLVALAHLWDTFYRFGESRDHAEARMASREFGLSPLSRRQLQWEIKRVAAAARPTPDHPARPRGVAALSVLQGKKAG